MLHITAIYRFLLCLFIFQNVSAQNEMYSEGTASSETNKSCTNDSANTTDDTCEMDKPVDLEYKEILEKEEVNNTLNSTDLYNSTFSGENVTEEDKTDMIQTTSSTETSIEPSSTTVEAPAEARPISNEACICDLTMDSCDINCCCDTECSKKDRLAFSECVLRPQYDFDSRHCYQTQFIYRNNTEFKSIQSSNGLFCIVRDNLPSRFLFQNRKTVNTLHQFNKFHRRHKTFSWPSQDLSRPVFVPTEQYKAGATMWMVTNKTLVPFSLPVCVTSALCQTTKIMYYLNDWSGECSHAASDRTRSIDACENNPGLSAVSFYSGFTILSAPQLLNDSHTHQFKEGCPASICVPVTTFLCSVKCEETSDFRKCVEVSDIQYPIYNSETGVCHSVVKQLNYKIYHNGTDGITKVHLYVFLTNVTLQRELSQTFTVSFHWAKDGNVLFHRSGNPGYIVGKPVMAGRKVTQIINTEEEIDKEAIEVSENPKDWLSIAAAKYNGECNLSQINDNFCRQTVTFGEDRLSSCAISIKPTNFTSSSSCAAMQKTILNLLAGINVENVTAVKNFNLYVATFGDSKVEDTSDWVQVILESIPSFVSSSSLQKGDWSLMCKSLVTSIHIDIMYAYVGSLAVPQAKILGVVFRFGKSHDIIYPCSSLNCADDNQEQYVKVVSSVSFTDVTKPPVTEFAEPPVYEIKLPHDFFYPFFSNSSFLYPSNIMLLLLFILILVMN